jgi:hypothetical protein
VWCGGRTGILSPSRSQLCQGRGCDTPAFTRNDKASFADPAVVSADPRGLPLDRNGVNTPGPRSTSFVAAFIPKGQTDYIAYTRRTQTSPITNNSAVQPAGFDVSATTTIGVYSSRDLSEFDLGVSRSGGQRVRG